MYAQIEKAKQAFGTWQDRIISDYALIKIQSEVINEIEIYLKQQNLPKE